MPIRPLDEWAAARNLSLPLASLKDSVVGIDASHYLSLHLRNPSTREPLLAALGGLPFALRANIERELQTLKDLGIGCVFVFNGLDFGSKESRPNVSPESVRAFEQAWELYDQQQADQVVDAFSSAGTPRPESLYRFLQRILHQNSVDFIQAPYSAIAQLSYLARGDNPLVDAVFGPSEAFLFDIDKLITRIEADSGQFFWIAKQSCQDDLGRQTNEQFFEFCLLLGSSFLRAFPPFENPAFPGKVNIRDALPVFNGSGRSALALCSQFEEDRRVQELQYADRYKRAFMTIRHHAFISVDGKVRLMNQGSTPSDMHELIGQRLPEELYFYISKGVLGPDIPNFLTSGDLWVPLPLGTEDTEIYRRITGDSLIQIKLQAIRLLSNSLHRFYQTKIINVRIWYDGKAERPINLKGLPSVRETIQPWKLSAEQLPEGIKKLQGTCGPFRFAVQSLKNPEFQSKSFARKEAPALLTQSDILANVFWRFLQLRGYIDEKHQLTVWGTCLEQALSVLGPADPLEEATFIAIEMLRLGILSSQEWFPHLSGAAMRGSDEDRACNMLVSRVACIAKLQHKSIGYSGPLSREMLCYRSLISAVRMALRDLIEVVLAGLFLNGDANRVRKDWTDMSLTLPFIDDNDCGLGIAVRTYLDDLPLQADPTSAEARSEVKGKGKDWFQHSESFTANLEMAFKLWDAAYKATQSAGKEAKDAELFENANRWLEGRR